LAVFHLIQRNRFFWVSKKRSPLVLKSLLPSPERLRNLRAVTKPLAVVFYESLLPGSQLTNKLADLGWRVLTSGRAADVAELVRKEKPMVLVAQLTLKQGDFCGVIRELKRDPTLAHIPVIGYTALRNQKLQDAAVKAGAKLVAAESAILDQLPHLLEHALAVE
jgi:CheY-like chemotaxis protein